MTNFGLLSSDTVQNIQFPINGESSAAVVADTVLVLSSSGTHKNGSSKVKLSNIVDYSWEERYYYGQLLAVHMEGKFIAYSIKGNTHAVRIVNRETGKRALIKGFGGMVEDLEFAFIPTQVTLACVDEMGSVFVHNIFEDAKDIAASLLLHIVQVGQVPSLRRVFWCPFSPDETDEEPYSDETALLLAVTRDTKIEIWNVMSASSTSSGPFRSDMCPSSCIVIDAHDSAIVAAALSPDGTAIATASIDGDCKFFQVYLQSEGEPTCLHQWKPHGGKPVTSLFFLDDHKCGNPDVKFWKYALTGTDDNTELCLWTCETWKCLQTIRFYQNLPKKFSKLKVSVDISSGYVFVSDMFKKLLYVLELEKGNEDTIPYIRTVTEFTFPCPILSFAIVEAGPHILKGNTVFGEDLTNGEEEELLPAVRARLYLVQPKSLQECHILFQTSNAVVINSIPIYTAAAATNGMDEIPTTALPAVEPLLPPPQPSSLNLMTPDAFHSPHSSDASVKSRKSGGTPAGESVPFPSNLVIPNGELSVDGGGGGGGGGGGERTRGEGFVSGGSSPSREVEEILASPMYFANEADIAVPQSKVSNNINNNNKQFDIITSLSIEMNEKLKSLESSVSALQSDVHSIIQAVDAKFERLEEELKENRGTSLSEVEGAITNAVSTYKPVSEQDIVVAITPLITQAVLTVINPAVIKSMADLHSMVHSEVAAKLSSTDTLIKENISKLVKSKQFSELLARSFTNSISSTIETVFRESFTRTVVPMFEAACGSMFKQMSDTFSKGINDTIKAFDEQATLETASIQSAAAQLAETSQKFTSTIEKETRGLEEAVTEVEKRLKACLNGAAAVRSGTATPALGFDPHAVQSQLSLLIKQGQYNTAFQQALSASDLAIVTYVCDRIDVGKVFTRGGCVLQQHVLLSLIQQLAADMSSHSETKQRYLEGAVMNLLPNNENTREHMPQVLSGLHKQLLTYSQTSLDPSLASKTKLLAMACQQMVRNIKEDWE